MPFLGIARSWWCSRARRGRARRLGRSGAKVKNAPRAVPAPVCRGGRRRGRQRRDRGEDARKALARQRPDPWQRRARPAVGIDDARGGGRHRPRGGRGGNHADRRRARYGALVRRPVLPARRDVPATLDDPLFGARRIAHKGCGTRPESRCVGCLRGQAAGRRRARRGWPSPGCPERLRGTRRASAPALRSRLSPALRGHAAAVTRSG
jgi:hypothetical protein